MPLNPEDSYPGYTLPNSDDAVFQRQDFISPPPYFSNCSRPTMNQEEFDAKYGYRRPNHKHGTTFRHFSRFTKRYWKPFTSPMAFLNTLISFVPILSWLPKYKWKEYFPGDFIGGITIAIIHVPQGIAYAILCHVRPVYGLYTSLFPPLFYMFFGTSRHSSIGTLAVVSLMAGKSVIRICGQVPNNDYSNSTMTGSREDFDQCALETVTTLSFCVGLIHIFLAILRLEIIVTYFSDQLISGFISAASFLVFATQFPALFGIEGLPETDGFGMFSCKIYQILSNLDKANWLTTVIGFLSMIFLIFGKDYVTPFLKKKFKLSVPVPFELILVIITTFISAVFKLNTKHNVDITGNIPTGVPTPRIPKFGRIPDVLMDGITIAFVVIALHISLSKLFAKKLNYKIDPGQELYAFGLSASLSSLFPIYPVSCAMGRTMVIVEVGAKTQLSAIPSSAFLIAIIAYFGKWLEDLPRCVLSAIVIISLKSVFKKFLDLKELWKLSRVDFSIWVVSFVATIGWNISQGLMIAIIWALFTTVLRIQFPKWNFISALPESTDFIASERYPEIVDYKGICIFRYEAPLLFTNVEKFKNDVHKAFKIWQNQSSTLSSVISPEEVQFNEKHFEYVNNILAVKSITEKISPEEPCAGLLYQHFVIDCSGLTFVDYMGVNTLKEIFAEMRNKKVLVYFAAVKFSVRDLFEASGFYKFVPKCNFYPAIRDAVMTAQKRRNASTLHLLDEIRENYEPLDEAVRTYPE